MKCRNAPRSVSQSRSGIRRRAGASHRPLASQSCREAGLLASPAAPLWFWDRPKLSCSTAACCAYAPVHSEVFAFWSLTKGRSEDTEAVSLLGQQESRASSKHSWTWAPLPRFPYTSAAMTSQRSLQRETLCWHWVSSVSLGCICPWEDKMENAKDAITPKSGGNVEVLLKALMCELTYQQPPSVYLQNCFLLTGFSGRYWIRACNPGLLYAIFL